MWRVWVCVCVCVCVCEMSVESAPEVKLSRVTGRPLEHQQQRQQHINTSSTHTVVLLTKRSEAAERDNFMEIFT